MSMNKNYYVIIGYDLTGFKTDKYDDWKWTDEGQKYLCYQSKGRVQLFDDPMSNSHFYFGHILAAMDEYEFETVNIVHGEFILYDCFEELKYLIDIGVVDKSIYMSKNLNKKMIIFEECS